MLDGRETNLSGGNMLARWSYKSGARSTTVQAYVDHFYRRVPNQYRGTLNTVDVDAQQQWTASRHNVVFGAGYRRYGGDDLGDGPGFYFDPQARTSDRVNVFGQDEIRLTPEVFLTVGSKFERNEFTGFEIQPTVRARWTRGHHRPLGRHFARRPGADAVRHRPQDSHPQHRPVAPDRQSGLQVRNIDGL